MAASVPAPAPLAACELLPPGSPGDAAVRAELMRAFGCRRLLDETPAPNPVSMDAGNNVAQVASQAYYASAKTDGIRVTLVLTRAATGGGGSDGGGGAGGVGATEPLAAMVDRSLRAFVVPLLAAAPLYEGTVLDGELVAVGDAWRYVVFDVVDAGGAGLATAAALPYGERLQYLRALVGGQGQGQGAPPCSDSQERGGREGDAPPATEGPAPLLAWDTSAPTPPVAIVTKVVLPLSELPALLAARAADEVPSDGLVLTRHSGRVGVGKTRSMFKVKDVGRDTLDVRVVVHAPAGGEGPPAGGTAGGVPTGTGTAPTPSPPPPPEAWKVLYKHSADEVEAEYGFTMGNHAYRMVLAAPAPGVVAALATWEGWATAPAAPWLAGRPPPAARPLSTARHALLECTWVLDEPRRTLTLTPLLVRRDKPHANDISTIVATLMGRLGRTDVPALLRALVQHGIVDGEEARPWLDAAEAQRREAREAQATAAQLLAPPVPGAAGGGPGAPSPPGATQGTRMAPAVAPPKRRRRT